MKRFLPPFLPLFLLLLVPAGCVAGATGVPIAPAEPPVLADKADNLPGHDEHGHTVDPPSTHGMLAAGSEDLYLSHLPMFHVPHHYQALFVAAVKGRPGQADPMATYVQDRERTGEPMYTIVPSRFVLPAILDATPEAPFTFTTDIVRGHFERGGRTIVRSASATIERVIHFRQLDAEAPRPTELTYILFGTAGEAFVAHYITSRPDFDQVLEVDLPAGFVGEEGTVTAEQLATGVLVTVPEADVTVELTPDTTVAVRVPGDAELAELGLENDEGDAQPQPVSFDLALGRQLYLERGDLEL